MSRTIAVALWLVVVLVATACGTEDVSGPSTITTSTTIWPTSGSVTATTILRTTTTQPPIATTTTSPPPDVTPPQSPSLALRFDGLGIFGFGDPVDDVADGLVASLGSPTTDEIVLDGQPEVHGYPTNTYWRSIGWDDLGLAVMFSDVSESRRDGVPHFAGWRYVGSAVGPALKTAEGVSVGMSLESLSKVLGGRLHLGDEPDECYGIWAFWVGEAPPDEYSLVLRGSLSGGPDGPDTVVEGLSAGLSSSC